LSWPDSDTTIVPYGFCNYLHNVVEVHNAGHLELIGKGQDVDRTALFVQFGNSLVYPLVTGFEEVCRRYFFLNLKPVISGDPLGRPPLKAVRMVGPRKHYVIVGFRRLGRCGPKGVFFGNHLSARREQTAPGIDNRRQALLEHRNNTVHVSNDDICWFRQRYFGCKLLDKFNSVGITVGGCDLLRDLNRIGLRAR